MKYLVTITKHLTWQRAVEADNFGAAESKLRESLFYSEGDCAWTDEDVEIVELPGN